MSEYNFVKPNVLKAYALDSVLKSTPFYTGLTYNQPESLIVYTSQELSSEQYQTLSGLIESFTDPEVFLSLVASVPDTLRSSTTSSSTPEVVQTFIYSNTFNGVTGTFNAIKTVLEYKTNNVQNFVNFSGQCFVTFEIYCYTRNFLIASHQLDITDVCESWKQSALEGSSDPAVIYKTFMVEGLRNVVANYDCLWNYKLSVSDPNVQATIHAKQMLYYDLM